MDLQIQKYSVPDKISFNYDEMKSDLISKVEKYQTMVYSDDQIKEAKADKASLNKLKKALNDERIRQEKEYMKPFTEFKAQINEIIKIIDEPIAAIDEQVKLYEERQKQEKLEIIKSEFSKIDKPDFLTLEMIFDNRWLNSSVKMKAIMDDFEFRIIKIKQDLQTIESMADFSFEATEVYKQTLDLNRAIAEGKRLSEIQKRKEEARKKSEEQKIVEIEEKHSPVIEKKEETNENVSGLKWVTFKALVTKEDLDELMKFFDLNLIEVHML